MAQFGGNCHRLDRKTLSNGGRGSWVVSAILGASIFAAILRGKKREEKPSDKDNLGPGSRPAVAPARVSLTSPSEAEELRLRMSSAFATSYLTLISIIQGVVVAVSLNSWLAPSSYSLAATLRLAFSLSIAVFVWHHYMMGVASFFWRPHMYDTLIPLGLGATQVFLARNLESEHDSWYLGGAIFSAVAGLALVNMFVNASKTHESRFAFESVGVMPRALGGTVAVGIAGFLILAYWPNRNEYVGAIASLLLAGNFGVTSLVYWSRLTRAAIV